MSDDLLRLPATTTEYVFNAVRADDAAGDAVDLSATPVFAAFLTTTGNPTGDDWVAAEWEAGPVDGWYRARVLVGPAGSGADVELATGRYNVWVRVTDDPEDVVRKTGVLVYR